MLICLPDLKFQGKFQAFYQYAKTFNADDFDYEELKNSDFVFMRWKVRHSSKLTSVLYNLEVFLFLFFW